MDVGLLLITQHNCLQMVICPTGGRTDTTGMTVRFQLLSRDVQHQLEVKLRSFKTSFTTLLISVQCSTLRHMGRQLLCLTFFSLIFSHSISCLQVILVLKSVDVFKPDTHFKISLQIVSHVLAYTSSCINPLLYAFLSENFRKAFRKVGLHVRYPLRLMW